jgi:uncharacterized protein (TIGR03083 family)
MTTPSFADMLALIEDRSAALRRAASAAGLTARVPGCPEWSVTDLVAHLGEVQRFWAAAVAAGPATSPPGDDQVTDRQPTGDLMAWSAASTAALIRALRDAGPELGCWTWWEESGAPMTAAAVARHQVQEAAVHAFDAQEAAGKAEPLPDSIAVDGVGEFLTVGMASMGPWPHQAGEVALASDEGGTWLVRLSEAGAQSARLGKADAVAARPDASVRGTASDLVLVLYNRNLHRGVDIDGNRELADSFLAWSDTE